MCWKAWTLLANYARIFIICHEDRQTVSLYTPKKTTVAAFALALALPIEEALDLFGKAGYYLTRNSKFDIIIEYFIEHKNYSIFDVNNALYEYGLPLIGV